MMAGVAGSAYEMNVSWKKMAEIIWNGSIEEEKKMKEKASWKRRHSTKERKLAEENQRKATKSVKMAGINGVYRAINGVNEMLRK